MKMLSVFRLASLMLGFSSIVPHAAARTYCLRCHDAHSLKDCVTTRCSTGPECYLQITEDQHGTRRYNGGCNTATYCTELAFKPGSHDYHRPGEKILCNSCCLSGNRCVPDQCKAHLNEKPSEFRLDQGIQCEVCNGGTCGIFPGQDPVLQCPDDLPYCMNVVRNEANGNKQLTKLCASESDCDAFWLNKTSHRSECTDYDPANIYTSSFQCSYCCLTPHCNKDIRPPTYTLYLGVE